MEYVFSSSNATINANVNDAPDFYEAQKSYAFNAIIINCNGNARCIIIYSTKNHCFSRNPEKWNNFEEEKKSARNSLYSLHREHMASGTKPHSLPFSIGSSHLAFKYAFIQNVINKSFKQFEQSGN